MIAVVTGGSGFIGRNLVGRLLADGHTVRCLTRVESRGVPDGASRWPVRYADEASLASSDALDGADVVFHLAGATVAVSEGAFEAANVRPTRNLLRALAERRFNGRFIHVSSQAAAGPAKSLDATVIESDDPAPVEAYGRSKLAAERVVEGFVGRLATTIVRPSSVFGPWDRDFFAVFRMASFGLVLYPGVASQSLSLLHVSDVVDGLLAAAASRRAIGRTYFLSSNEPVSWHALGAEITNAAGARVRHVDIPWRLVWAASLAGDMVGRITGRATLLNRNKVELARHSAWHCSAARAREELGFRERQSLPEALRETYLWYVRNGWLPSGSVNAVGT